MDRTAIFIDAGYLFAAGSILVTGEKLKRRQLQLDNRAFLSLIRARAESWTGLPLLRVYWYDGTSGAPTPSQTALAYEPDVKLRLGLVNRHGEQKGVDSLIVTDLINLSHNKAMACAVLLTGDEDIRVGVQQAQEYGVRVYLVGIAPSPGGNGNQGALLRQEADVVCHVTREEVSGFLTRRLEPEPEPALTAAWVTADAAAMGEAATPLSEREIEGIVTMVMADLDAAGVEEVAASRPSAIPRPIDGRLLRAATEAIGRSVPENSKKALRSAFFEACRQSVGA